MKIVHIKLEASSLIETIVAMMIVMLVFFIAMTVYINILRNSVSLSEISASQRLQCLAQETKKNKSYFNETLVEETFTIMKTCNSYASFSELFLLDMEAKDRSGRIIATHKELILKQSDE